MQRVLARHPTARRVVEFVADAAALAAADAASAVAADDAAVGRRRRRRGGGGGGVRRASGCAPDGAWSPALEDAVERAAMAAARDALAPASRRAAEDAARRAAAATKALLVPDAEHRKKTPDAHRRGPVDAARGGPCLGHGVGAGALCGRRGVGRREAGRRRPGAPHASVRDPRARSVGGARQAPFRARRDAARCFKKETSPGGAAYGGRVAVRVVARE